MIEGPRKRGASFKLATGKELAIRMWRLVVPPQRQVDVFLWNLRLASRLLWVILAGLGAYVVLDVWFMRPPARVSRAVGSPSGGADEAPPSVAALRPLSEYVAALTQRNPFTGGAGGVVDQPVVSKTARRELEELASGLTVVGIDRGPSPVALIESQAEQRTFIVKEGDEVNGLRVIRIGPEGVIVSYEGEETLLK